MPVEATLAIQNQAVMTGTFVAATSTWLFALLLTSPVAMAARMPHAPGWFALRLLDLLPVLPERIERLGQAGERGLRVGTRPVRCAEFRDDQAQVIQRPAK